MEHEIRYSTSQDAWASRELRSRPALASVAEDLFVEVFCDAFGPEKTQYLSIQYPFVDIYGNRRFVDFALESESFRIAIEIDGETFHLLEDYLPKQKR